MFFRKKPRKKIFLTNIHYDCFDLLNHRLDALALPALVRQHVAAHNGLANVGQAAVADDRGKTLINENKCRYCHFFSLRLMDECMYQMEIYI